uniref:Derlin n=1 Tax=Poecilia reticulata TaxID=8081 RepID=A0A3P9PG86_POERE
MSDIGDWFRSIPLITRYWFAASIAVPFIGKLGLIDFRNLMLFPELVFSRFQLWRPVTATLYFPITPNTGFLYMVNLYFLYHYSTRLETGAFDGRPADYVFMLLFNWICIVITGLLMDMRLLMIPLIMSVLYVWAQFNSEMIVSFWFGTRFKVRASNLVHVGHEADCWRDFWRFCCLHACKRPVKDVCRSICRHITYLGYRFFPNTRGGVSGFGVPPTRRPVPQEPPAAGRGGGRHNWGQGFRLGGE